MALLLEMIKHKQDFWVEEERLDVNEADENGITPLMYVASVGDGTRIFRLLMKGADIYQKDNEGQTALHHAAKRGQNVAAEILYRKGADPHHPDNNEKTPFDYAIESNNFTLARTFLSPRFHSRL